MAFFEAMGCIFLADEKSGSLVMKSQKGFPPELLKTCAIIPFGKCLCGRAAESKETVFASHIDDRHDILAQGVPDHGHYCIPIQSKGLLLGIINFYVKAGHKRTEREEDFLKAVANTLAGILMQKRGEEQKKEIEKQLHQSQKMEAIGTLAGGIAHDFNNILSGIFGYAQLSLININEPDKVRSDIDQIILGAKRATDLIQQILTFSRQTEHEKKAVRFDLIIKETVKFLRSSIPSNIRINEDIQSKSKVTANPTQVHQIVINLCTNAYHAMVETGGSLTVRLLDQTINTGDDTPHHALAPGDYVRLEIADTGHDMPIIMCTGFSHKISEHQALKMGVKKYLQKPIEANTLLSTIRDVLDHAGV